MVITTINEGLVFPIGWTNVTGTAITPPNSLYYSSSFILIYTILINIYKNTFEYNTIIHNYRV